MAARKLIRALLAVTGAIAALALIARAWIGPFQFIVSVHSPMNAGSIFGGAIILLVVSAPRSKEGEPDHATPRLHVVLSLATLILAGLAAHFSSLWVGLVADDYSHLRVASQATFSSLGRGFAVPLFDNLFFRPVAMVSYAIDYRWAGDSAPRWHAAGLTLHMLNALLVFALARKLALAVPFSLFAALLFAIHGSRPEAVTWVAARFDLLATGFVLASLLLFLAYRERPKPVLMVSMLFTAACGMLSKESAFVLPALMFALAWYRAGWTRPALRAIGAVSALAVVLFLYRWIVVGGIGGYIDQQGRATISTFNAPLVLKALFLRMGAVLIVPINWTDPLSPALRVTLALSLAALLLLAIRARLDRLTLLGIAFALIAALPVYHLLLIGPDLEKSRVIYLGSAGFAIFLAALTRSAPRRTGVVAVAAVLAFNAAALRHNLGTWDRVARIHVNACDYLGSEAARLHSGVVAIGMPNTWDGVYMLATGLPECVAIRHGVPAQSVHLVPDRNGAAAFPGLPKYIWDGATARVARWD